MAVDDAILESYATAEHPPPPTLRLYSWAPAALSLGRGQPAHGSCEPAFLRRQGIDLVRRPTGGLAVLHEHERTYSVCGPLRGGDFSGRVLEIYVRLAQTLVAALRRLGLEAQLAASGAAASPADAPVPACFHQATAHEITWRGKKLIGSAQLRRRRAFLQHGSILLRLDAERLAAAVGREFCDDSSTDLRSALGREPCRDELDHAIGAAVEESFQTRLTRGTLTSDEALRASQLYSWKYLSAEWTLGRTIGAREERWGPLRAR